MLVSLASSPETFDVILIDDHSKQVDIPAEAEKWGVQVLRWNSRDNSPMGLTHAWNLAWNFASNGSQYENLIIANNDIIVPSGSISNLESALSEGWDILTPLTSARGSFYKKHTLDAVFENVKGWTNQVLRSSEVARALEQVPTDEAVVLSNSNLNGYFIAMRIQKAKAAVYDKERNLLFNPDNINVRNEGEFMIRCKMRGLKLGVHTRSFVYHFKSYTVPSAKSGRRARDDIQERMERMKEPS